MSMTRLFHQLYLTIFGALLIVVFGVIGLWQLSGRKNDAQIALESVATFDFATLAISGRRSGRPPAVP